MATVTTTARNVATGTLNRQAGYLTHSFSEKVRRLCKHNRLKEALNILHSISQPVDNSTYVSLLQGCIEKKSLSDGKSVHTHMLSNKDSIRHNNTFLLNTLLNMYTKCGSVADARNVFDNMTERDVFSWTVMISAYAKHGLGRHSVALFHQMKEGTTSIQPSRFTFASVLSACANLAALQEGIRIHHEIIRSGIVFDIFLGNALIDMYVKCGSVENGRDMFDKMPQRDVVSWTSMIAGYAHNGDCVEALKLFQEMQVEGVVPDAKTFSTVLPAIADLEALEQGMWIHREVIKRGFQTDVFVHSALVDMYAKCGIIENAHNLFVNMSQRNVVTWNSMIRGYGQIGNVDKAAKLFQQMPERDSVSWLLMVAGYAQNGHGEEALKLFKQMQLAGVELCSKVYINVISACANMASLEQGLAIHEEIIRSGFQYDVFVGSALVGLYAKCTCIDNARRVFDKMLQRDVVSWTTMIVGYAQNGYSLEALRLFQQMQQEGVKPDSNTFASVLPICANIAALEQGIEIHQQIIRSGFQSDVFVESALVDMYAKCGRIDKARNLFDRLHQRNVVSWTTMIVGYAMHGFGKEAINLFEQMQESGVNPNHVTLVGVLSACCHAGLVERGRQCFNQMSQRYHINPAMEHYGCMVDLFGRAGHIDEARDFINRMPIKPDATVWGSLLGACRMQNNIEVGELAAEHLFELNPKDTAAYVLLSNIYAATGRWDDIQKVRQVMKDMKVEKVPGCSWIEINRQVHAFLVGDISHPQTLENNTMLGR